MKRTPNAFRGNGSAASNASTRTLNHAVHLVVAFCCLFNSTARVGGAGSDPRRTYQRAVQSVLTLQVENRVGECFVGSGVLAFSDDTVATAWHVVADARHVWATFADGSRLRVLGVLDHDCQRDVALLKLERSVSRRRATLNLEILPVASRVFVMGAPKGLGFSIADGLVSQVRSVDGFDQYQVSCPISPGNSGGPLLTAQGKLIGIISWTRADAQNVSFAIPCRELLRLNLKSQLVPWDQMPAEAKAADLAPSRKVDDWFPLAKADHADTAAGFGQFATELERLAGKQVTVLLRNNGRQTKFIFEVPSRVRK